MTKIQFKKFFEGVQEKRKSEDRNSIQTTACMQPSRFLDLECFVELRNSDFQLRTKWYQYKDMS